MMTRCITPNRCLLACVLAGMALARPAAAQSNLVRMYEMIELSSPDSGDSKAYALNNTGQIVGWVTSGEVRHAAHWHARVTTDLHGTVHFELEHFYAFFDEDYSEAYDISNGDQIVGTARTHIVCPPAVIMTNAFVLRPAVLTDLATPYPGDALTNLRSWGTPCIDDNAWDSAATGISNANHVVGWADTRDGTIRAFLVRPVSGQFYLDDEPVSPDPNLPGGDGVNDLMIDLGTLGASDPVSCATAVNDEGVVTGYSYTLLPDGTAAYHAFLLIPIDNNGDGRGDVWYAGANNVNTMMTDIGTLGGTNSWGRDVNSSRQVVGESDYDSDSGEHYTRPFLWDNGVMTDLGTLQSDRNKGFGSALAINNEGVIVGWAENDNYQRRAFIWENGEMYDLNELLYLYDSEGFPVTPRITLVEARDINEDGIIVGWGTIGTSENAQTVGFLLNPVLVDPNDLVPDQGGSGDSGGSGGGSSLDNDLILGTPGNLTGQSGDPNNPNAGAMQPRVLCGVFPLALLPLLVAGVCLIKCEYSRRRRG